MAAIPKRALAVETEWLRAYARTYVPSEAPFAFPPNRLRRSGVTLIDVRNALRDCYVTFSDKLDGPGAVWIAEGEDADGRLLRLTVIVVSEAPAVTLQEIEVVESMEDPNDHAA